MSGWAVFLDRDGTLIESAGLVTRWEQVRILPRVVEGLKKLKAAGAKLIVATNQPVVARGLIGVDELAALHARLRDELEAAGGSLDGVFYCPHHPETHHPEAADPKYRCDCGCRKPKPGLLTAAAAEYDLDLTASFMVGDTARDIGAGKAAGCRTVLVRSGAEPEAQGADAVVEDMAAAADWILEARA